MQEEQEHAVDRRRLLRRAGTVAAGVAGAGVVGAVAAPGAAQAAPGDPVLQGRANNVGTADTTTIANSGGGSPTLALTNSGTDAEGFAGPALRLTPSGAISPGAPTGSLSVDEGGGLWQVVEFDAVRYQAAVYSNANANITVPLAVPQRVLDTRSAASRENVINKGELDSAGRVKKGATIHVNLGSYVLLGVGLLGNLTVVNPVAGGYVTVYPYLAPRPNISSINFNAGGVLSNFTATAIGWDPANEELLDVVSIFCQQSTHVLLDVVAFIVGSPDQILAGFSAQARSAGPSTEEARRQLALKKVQQKRAG